MSTIETKYWHTLDNGQVQCDLCPRHCHMSEGRRGFCYIRGNENGKVVLHSYGRATGLAIDPVEKKPLNHFYPGTKIFSIGTAGCNLGCLFCQNWDISKARDMDILNKEVTPEQVVSLAKENGCPSIAFTYNEPIIFFEFARDIAKLARKEGINTVAVSNGFICEEPRKEFFSYMDAANIDLKGFTEDFYSKITKSHLEDVKETLIYLKNETDVWLEITNLMIPGKNDSPEEIDAMTKWIYKELGPDVPIHFTAFYPAYKMLDVDPTPAETLVKARETAMNNGLHYVYVGNISDKTHESTYCPECKKMVIERDRMTVYDNTLLAEGKCPNCKFKIPGKFSS